MSNIEMKTLTMGDNTYEFVDIKARDLSTRVTDLENAIISGLDEIVAAQESIIGGDA